MGRADYYRMSDYNAICFECGRKRKASELKHHWQGYYVCPEHWESRHPQDFVRAVPELQTVPWSQPYAGDIFGRMCTPNGVSAVPGAMIPGCIVPAYLSPMYNPQSDI